MTEYISQECNILLDLLSNSLFNAGVKIDVGAADLEKLFNEAMAQTVLGVTFDVLPKEAEERNAAVYDKWQKYSFTVIQNNMVQMYSNANLEKIFKEANLPVCTIKGFASAYYYPKAYLRQMGDIDFMVPVERMEDSKKILSEAGFICGDAEEEHDFHIEYKKDGVIYEMHKGITSVTNENSMIKEYIADIFSDCFPAAFNGVTITIPGQFAHGLIMLLHLQRHMQVGGGIGLRHLCDWAVFVNSIDDAEWKKIFEKKLKNLRLWKFAQALSKVSSIYLKMPEKEWFSATDEKIAEALLLDILCGGNFGRKDIKRFQELIFVAPRNKSEKKFRSYARSYIRKVYSWNTFFKRHKIFLPIGVFAYFFRTAFLIIFGRKKINLKETHESGSKRNNLYRNIFE